MIKKNLPRDEPNNFSKFGWNYAKKWQSLNCSDRQMSGKLRFLTSW